MKEIIPKELIQAIPSPYLEDLLEISKTVSDAGGEAYLVGGSVRDLVLGKIPHEYDLAVSLFPEKIQKLFRRTVPTGIKHGTITVLFQDRAYELTTFRKDEDYQDGRRPETVHFGVSLSEDLRRRDFTINAIALDLLQNKLVDEHKGLEDIQSKLIRTIGNPISRFTEDGLRPVRAIRFVASLGFTIHPETAEAIQECKPIVAKVSPERIHDEFLKILRSADPKLSLTLLREYGILELFTKAKLYPSPLETWKEVLEGFSSLPTQPDRVRLAYFLLISFGLETLVEQSLLFFKDLRFSNQRIKDSQFLARTLDSLLQNSESLAKESGIRKFLLHPIAHYAGKEELNLWCGELANLWRSYQGKEPDWLIKSEEEWKGNPPVVLGDLALDGNTIRENFPQIEPRKLGEVLKVCLDFILEDPNQNTKETLFDFIRSSSFFSP